MTVRVVPNDGRYDWHVTKSGRTKSRHRKKSAAKTAARRVAKKAGLDSYVVHRSSGTVQGKRRV